MRTGEAAAVGCRLICPDGSHPLLGCFRGRVSAPSFPAKAARDDQRGVEPPQSTAFYGISHTGGVRRGPLQSADDVRGGKLLLFEKIDHHTA